LPFCHKILLKKEFRQILSFVALGRKTFLPPQILQKFYKIGVDHENIKSPRGKEEKGMCEPAGA
jgi:hypothetical protein